MLLFAKMTCNCIYYPQPLLTDGEAIRLLNCFSYIDVSADILMLHIKKAIVNYNND